MEQNWTENNIQKKWKEFIEKLKTTKDIFFWNQYLCNLTIYKNSQNNFFIVAKNEKIKNLIEQEQIVNLFKIFSKINLKIDLIVQAENDEKTKQGPEFINFPGFVVGDFNRGAFEAAKQIIWQTNNWGCLFIHSEPGLGKTFLLKSIKSSKNFNCNFFYITGSDFGSQLFDFFGKTEKSQLIQEWKKKIYQHDVLFFDDIHILAERKKTQAVLSEIISKAQDLGKSVIYTSDQPPENLIGFEKRLRSRFHSGLTIKIDYPNVETAIKITKEKIEKIIKTSELVTANAIRKIATFFRKDIRRIEGAIKQLGFFLAQNKGKIISEKLLEEIFIKINENETTDVSIQKIKRIVARHYSISYSAILSKSRKKETVEARYVSFYLTRILTTKSHMVIAKSFHSKNHTTVVNAVKKIRQKIATNPQFKKKLNLIKDECLEL